MPTLHFINGLNKGILCNVSRLAADSQISVRGLDGAEFINYIQEGFKNI